MSKIIEYECDNCGARVKEDDTVCPKCGSEFTGEIEEKVIKDRKNSRMLNCPACGNKTKETDKKCPYCGILFEDAVGKDVVKKDEDNVDDEEEFEEIEEKKS